MNDIPATPGFGFQPRNETWTKTMNLRYRQKVVESYISVGQIVPIKTEKILQQQSLSSTGNTKWEDIKLENE